VVAGLPVHRRRVGALPCARLFGSRHVALVGGRAHDGVATRADAALTRVGPGAGVAVVAGRAVHRRRVGALARGGITGPRHVALVGGRAHDGVATRADAALTRVGPGAGVAVVAGGAVHRRRVGALARGGITGPRHVALVRRRADDQGAGADATLATVVLRARVAVVAGRPVRLWRRRASLRQAVGHAAPDVACIAERGAVAVVGAEDRVYA